MSAIQQALADIAGSGAQARAEWAMRDADRRYEERLTANERAFAVREARRQESAQRRAAREDALNQIRMMQRMFGAGGR